MKKLIAGIGLAATGLGGGGIAVVNTATAATTQIYTHGGGHMASFTSWSTCQAHANWSVKNVAGHGGELLSGDVARAKCFPIASGRWTYLTVYKATKPLNKGDLDWDAMGEAPGDAMWMYSRDKSGPANIFTQAQCRAMQKTFDSQVVAGKSIRLMHPSQCFTNQTNSTRYFSGTYLGTSGSVGLKGDKSLGKQQSESLLAETGMAGYAIPAG